MKSSMTKIVFIKLCLSILLIIISFHCKVQKDITDDQISIGIINPGVGSLRGFEDLIENDILDIENEQLIAICYEKAENNYSRVEDVLKLEPNQRHKNYWQNNPTPVVYSSHHQAVKNTGLNIEIIATSMDEKVPEIIAHKIYKKVFGVQFHPQVSSLYHVNGSELKWFPDDSLRQTYYTHLQNSNSLHFHMKLWKKIGKLL